jgi:hypothetical protein
VAFGSEILSFIGASSMKKCLFASAVFIALLMLVSPVQASSLVPGAPPVPVDPITGLPAGSIVSNGGTVTVTPLRARWSLFAGCFVGTRRMV